MSEREQHSETDAHDVLPIVALYEAVEVPRDTAPLNPDDAHIQDQIDRFFEDILTSLRFNDLMQASYARVETEKVFLEEDDDTSYDESQTLSLRDLQALAVVKLTVREGMVRAMKAEKRLLEDETVAAIKGYHEGDTFLTHILFRE